MSLLLFLRPPKTSEAVEPEAPSKGSIWYQTEDFISKKEFEAKMRGITGRGEPEKEKEPEPEQPAEIVEELAVEALEQPEKKEPEQRTLEDLSLPAGFDIKLDELKIALEKLGWTEEEILAVIAAAEEHC